MSIVSRSFIVFMSYPQSVRELPAVFPGLFRPGFLFSRCLSGLRSVCCRVQTIFFGRFRLSAAVRESRTGE